MSLQRSSTETHLKTRIQTRAARSDIGGIKTACAFDPGDNFAGSPRRRFNAGSDSVVAGADGGR